MKMKMSVTIGVVQMTFGIVLSLTNHLHFGDTLGVLFEFIPQLVFMLSTFGYMVFLIIYKFCIDWNGDTTRAGPPNLIQTMIAMFLSPGSVSSDKQLYPGQGVVQGILVLLAFLSIPAMLLVKPLIIRSRHAALKSRGPQVNETQNQLGEVIGHSELKDNQDEKEVKIDVDPHVKKAPAHGGGGGGGHDDHGGGGEYSFSDHFITQCIHTIEFVLGAVSNTASYLRLWALSLAHAELASVFWDKMIMQYGVSKKKIQPWLSLVLLFGQQRHLLSYCVWMSWSVSYMLFVYIGSSFKINSFMLMDMPSLLSISM